MMRDRIAKLELSQRAEFTDESLYTIQGVDGRKGLMSQCDSKLEDLFADAQMAVQEVRGTDDAHRKYAVGLKVQYFFSALDEKAFRIVRAICSVIVTRER